MQEYQKIKAEKILLDFQRTIGGIKVDFALRHSVRRSRSVDLAKSKGHIAGVEVDSVDEVGLLVR